MCAPGSRRAITEAAVSSGPGRAGDPAAQTANEAIDAAAASRTNASTPPRSSGASCRPVSDEPPATTRVSPPGRGAGPSAGWQAGEMRSTATGEGEAGVRSRSVVRQTTSARSYGASPRPSSASRTSRSERSREADDATTACTGGASPGRTSTATVVVRPTSTPSLTCVILPSRPGGRVVGSACRAGAGAVGRAGGADADATPPGRYSRSRPSVSGSGAAKSSATTRKAVMNRIVVENPVA